MTRQLTFTALGASLLLLSACTEPEVILPGPREDIRADLAEPMAEPAPEAPAFSAPGTTANSAWTHRIGTAAYRTDNAALGASPQLAWSSGIGKGDSRKLRITADPVVADGRVYTLDAQAQVTATSAAGATLWTRDLTPRRDRAGDASGGGLAYGAGTLFVTSSFGLLTAIDGATGDVRWEQDLGGTGNGAPTYYDGVVYLVANDNTAFAVEADTGRVRWQIDGTPDTANVMGGPAPALNDKLAVFAYGSGELMGAFRQGGLRLWTATVAGQRAGVAVATVADITGDPVIDGSTVYAANHSGRLVALNVDSGERLWTADTGALGPVFPAGGSLFLVSDRNALKRIDAATGAELWSVDLPLFTKNRPRRQSEIFAHHGPILAGGRLVVASSDGLIRFFDPQDGAALGSVAVPGGATTAPVVAGGTLYVVSGRGQLHAFR